MKEVVQTNAPLPTPIMREIFHMANYAPAPQKASVAVESTARHGPVTEISDLKARYAQNQEQGYKDYLEQHGFAKQAQERSAAGIVPQNEPMYIRPPSGAGQGQSPAPQKWDVVLDGIASMDRNKREEAARLDDIDNATRRENEKLYLSGLDNPAYRQSGPIGRHNMEWRRQEQQRIEKEMSDAKEEEQKRASYAAVRATLYGQPALLPSPSVARHDDDDDESEGKQQKAENGASPMLQSRARRARHM